MSPIEKRAHEAIATACALALIYLLAMAWGPTVEPLVAPIRAGQFISAVDRRPDRLCWRWSSIKLRPAISDNMDVFIHANGDRSVAAVFLEETGEPWKRSGNVEPGPQSTRLCVLLPPSVHPEAVVRIEQVIFYHGWHDLWTVPVRVPDVNSAPP